MPIKDTEQRKKWHKEYLVKNRDRINTVAKLRLEKLRILLIQLKNKPCLDCGMYYPPECMDFDHVNGDKKAEIGQMVSKNVGVKTLMKEIEKCELVCSNCHRIRTRRRIVENK